MAESLTSKIVEKCFCVIAEFLKSKYGEDEKLPYKINSFSLQPACGSAENFLGAIFSCKFTVTQKTEPLVKDFDLILKSQLLTEPANSSAKYFWNILFTKEKMIYTDIMEKLEEIGELKLCPKMHHFFCEDEDYACLVLDNLISLGYYSPKSSKITFDECACIMKHLARLHSLSLVLEGMNGSLLPDSESYEFLNAEMFFSESMAHVFRPYVQASFNGILQACEKIRPDLVDKLKKFDKEEAVWKRGIKFVRAGQTSIDCVCHGDSRLGNIFLKEPSTSTGGEMSLRFIDFQITRYASPISDLVYTMYIGTSKEFRDEYMTQLLKIYYDEFQAILGRFSQVNLKPGVRDWSFKMLQEEFRAFHAYALVVAIVFLPVVLLRPTDLDSSIGDMTAEQREQFMVSNRAQIISDVLPKNQEMRERILEICDEFLI